ncbi:uncharacterized protein [Clytia hemisphaerica]|uniref:Ubiquitin-like domain-containing protein n=1 Tax=Clytia hemisphaerica TaxID=252671 RepID=A0A7M5XEZ1_9CNID|eukprot:TCONS_00014794-protein
MADDEFEIGIASEDDYGPEYPAFSLSVKETDTIGHIKTKIEERIKVPSQHFYVRKRGMIEVENEKTVSDYLQDGEKEYMEFVLIYIPQFLIRVCFTRSGHVEEQTVLLTEKHRKNLGDLVTEIEKKYKLKKGELKYVHQESDSSSDETNDDVYTKWLMNLWRERKYVLNFETDANVEDKKCLVM